MFVQSSRYYNLETITITLANGRIAAYKGRRFLPPGNDTAVFVEVVVGDRDRLDIITARTLGDPEHFWRICDTNEAMNPVDLTSEIGRTLRISLPQV